MWEGRREKKNSLSTKSQVGMYMYGHQGAVNNQGKGEGMPVCSKTFEEQSNSSGNTG